MKETCPNCGAHLTSKTIELRPSADHSAAVQSSGLGQYCRSCGAQIRLAQTGKAWLFLSAPLLIGLVLSLGGAPISVPVLLILAGLAAVGFVVFAVKGSYEQVHHKDGI